MVKANLFKGYLYMLPVTATRMEDVESRSAMAGMLICDDNPGMLDQMVRYPIYIVPNLH